VQTSVAADGLNAVKSEVMATRLVEVDSASPLQGLLATPRLALDAEPTRISRRSAEETGGAGEVTLNVFGVEKPEQVQTSVSRGVDGRLTADIIIGLVEDSMTRGRLARTLRTRHGTINRPLVRS
jgi:hypothetical protein